MKYTQPSFSVTNSGYTYARGACREVGHMATDAKGKCLRCGEPVETRDEHAAHFYAHKLAQHNHAACPGCHADFSKPEDWG